MTLNQALNNKNFENEFEVIVINNDKPINWTKTIKEMKIYNKSHSERQMMK